jgi:hypothetical protein
MTRPSATLRLAFFKTPHKFASSFFEKKNAVMTPFNTSFLLHE